MNAEIRKFRQNIRILVSTELSIINARQKFINNQLANNIQDIFRLKFWTTILQRQLNLR